MDQNAALQMIQQIAASAVTGAPAQPGGLLNINTVNTAPFQATPTQPPTIAYVTYKAPPLSAYVIGVDGISRTPIDPNLLSSLADTQRLMAAFAAAGYAVQGYNIVANPNEVYPTDLRQYVIRIQETNTPIPTGRALASEFRSGVDPSGNPHPGKWTLRDSDKAAGKEYFTYDDPLIAAWSIVPGTVAIL